jgi:hypothetical protein
VIYLNTGSKIMRTGKNGWSRNANSAPDVLG